MNETIRRIFNSPDDFLFSAKFLRENLQDAIFTLEKEIPNDDALDTVEQIYMSFGDNEIEEAIDILNQYAESYNIQKRDTHPLKEGKTRGDVKPFTYSRKPNKPPKGQK